jgi:hypothetical protein
MIPKNLFDISPAQESTSKILCVISKNTIISFLEWKDNQCTTIRGGKLMYDVKGYYKYLTESELLNYYIEYKN